MAEPRLKPHPPEEEDSPVRPARRRRRPMNATITLRVPKWKILMVLLGLLVGAVVAGGVVWWVVDRRPPTQTAGKKETAPPPAFLLKKPPGNISKKAKMPRMLMNKSPFSTKPSS